MTNQSERDTLNQLLNYFGWTRMELKLNDIKNPTNSDTGLSVFQFWRHRFIKIPILERTNEQEEIFQ
jgi:hypothetical protein